MACSLDFVGALMKLARVYTNSTHGECTVADLDGTQECITIDSLQLSDFGIRLGVTWHDLSVRVSSADTSICKNVLTQFCPRKIRQHFPSFGSSATAIDRSNGCVQPGEMLLVIGQPSACNGLLGVLAGGRGGYNSLTGEIWYGSIEQSAAKEHRSTAIFTDHNVNFPGNLTPKQILDFALAAKEPRWASTDVPSFRAWRTQMRTYLVQCMFGAEVKTENTLIANLPKSDKKLLSLAESLAMQPSVICWDEYTRDLDDRRAIRCTRTLRDLTNKLGLSSIASVVRATNEVYDMYDKVLILHRGKQVFYGPTKEGRCFVQSLASASAADLNIVDCLTESVTSSTQTAHAWPNGHVLAHVRSFQRSLSMSFESQSVEMNYPLRPEVQQITASFVQTASLRSRASELRSGLLSQLRACSVNRWQSLPSHLRTAGVKQFSTLLQALTCGTLMVNAPQDTSGLSVKTGALFFSVLFHSLMALSEIPDFFSNRPNVVKYRSLDLYHGTAVLIEQSLYDLFSIFVQVTVFSVPFYFLVGLTTTASAFFTYWTVLFSKSMTLVALFRFVAIISGSLNTATIVSGVLSNVMISYCGYVVSHPNMRVWFSWLFWINPDAWAYEALVDNEFRDKVIDCVGANLIPHGTSYLDTNHQACGGIAGAEPGKTSVTGKQYLHAQGYSVTRLWRNVGLMWVTWFCISTAAVIAIHKSSLGSPKKRSLLPTGHPHGSSKTMSTGSETPDSTLGRAFTVQAGPSAVSTNTQHLPNVSQTQELITWKNLSVLDNAGKYSSGRFQNVSGWLKPGTLTAVLGPSGAGKTALLNVLAHRVAETSVEGSILVDGTPPSADFKRRTGYCQNSSEIEPTITVREALLFSALLRQDSNISKAEKLRYVDTIIDLLGIEHISQCCIRTHKDQLRPEYRIRIQLAIELVVKPSVMFIDDFTSTLDREANCRIFQLLKDIANAGQTILVALRSPCSELLSYLDTALILNKSGRTMYFGEVGPRGNTVKAYFEKYGASLSLAFELNANLDNMQTDKAPQGRAWNDVWQISAERKMFDRELEQLVEQTAFRPMRTDRSVPSLWTQIALSAQHMSRARFRDTTYVNNAVILYVFSGLFNGFSYFQLGDSVTSQGLRQSTIFNFIFVAPGLVAQMQPHFLNTWHLYVTGRSHFYLLPNGWVAVVTGLILTEIPYLLVYTLLYFASWYFTVGLPLESSRAGAVFFTMFAYSLVYASMAQLIVACSPTITYASFFNPLILGNFVAFAGILVPYTLIPPFWRAWAYWANPFTYMVGSLFIATSWGFEITCMDSELAVFDPPSGLTCAEYLTAYQQSLDGSATNLLNPEATSSCRVCLLKSGTDWCHTRNYQEYRDGWLYAAFTVCFAVGYYILLYVVIALRYYITKRRAK